MPAGGTSAAVHAIVGVRVGIEAFPMAEERGGATALPGRRLARMGEPLGFLPRLGQRHFGQRQP